MGGKFGGKQYAARSNSSMQVTLVNSENGIKEGNSTSTMKLLEDRLKQIIPKKADMKKLNSSLRTIYDGIDKSAHLVGIHLFGSTVKDTNVTSSRKPDIDSLFELDFNLYKNLLEQKNGSKKALYVIYKALRRKYPDIEIKIDGCSLVIKQSDTYYDIVPALKKPGMEGYYIPDNDNKTWTISDPRRSIRILKIVDRKYDGKAKAMIRLIKHINEKEKLGLKSIHIENMVIGFLDQVEYKANDPLQYYLEDFLVRFPNYIKSGTLKDPSTEEIMGRYLDSEARTKAAKYAASLAQMATSAKQEGEKGHLEEETKILKKIMDKGEIDNDKK